MSKSIPIAPDRLPTDLSSDLRRLAEGWARHPLHPTVDESVLGRWDSLLQEWSLSDDLPLFIRNASLPRGTVVRHREGRALIPADNSPAH